MTRLACACAWLASCALLGCVSTAVEPPAAASAPHAAARVLVFYPAGACGGVLELELFDRAAAAWRPHPEHPRLAPGSCASELPGQLLNELRVRCADPTGERAPSEWVVGAELAKTSTPCASTSAR